MEEQPIRGSAVRRPYLSVAGIIEAPQDRVAEVLFTVRTGPVSPQSCFLLTDDEPGLVVQGGAGRYSASTPQAPDAVRLVVDRDQADGNSADREAFDDTADSITIQRQWWSQEDWRSTPSDDGTRVMQECFDVATHNRWLVSMSKFWATGRQRSRAQRLILRLGDHLDSRAFLI